MLEMNSMVLGLVGAYTVGVIVRVLVRYALAWAEAGEKIPFNFRYLIGQVVAAAAGVIPLVLSTEFLDQLGEIGELASGWIVYLIAGLYGYGAAALGRAGQKGIEIRRRNGKGNGGVGLGALFLLWWFWK